MGFWCLQGWTFHRLSATCSSAWLLLRELTYVITEHPHICSCILSFSKYVFSKGPSSCLWGFTVPYGSLKSVSSRGQPLAILLRGNSCSPPHAQNLETYIQYNHHYNKMYLFVYKNSLYIYLTHCFPCSHWAPLRKACLYFLCSLTMGYLDKIYRGY